jgi:hypothetical protein
MATKPEPEQQAEEVTDAELRMFDEPEPEPKLEREPEPEPELAQATETELSVTDVPQLEPEPEPEVVVRPDRMEEPEPEPEPELTESERMQALELERRVALMRAKMDAVRQSIGRRQSIASVALAASAQQLPEQVGSSGLPAIGGAITSSDDDGDDDDERRADGLDALYGGGSDLVMNLSRPGSSQQAFERPGSQPLSNLPGQLTEVVGTVMAPEGMGGMQPPPYYPPGAPSQPTEQADWSNAFAGAQRAVVKASAVATMTGIKENKRWLQPGERWRWEFATLIDEAHPDEPASWTNPFLERPETALVRKAARAAAEGRKKHLRPNFKFGRIQFEENGNVVPYLIIDPSWKSSPECPALILDFMAHHFGLKKKPNIVFRLRARGQSYLEWAEAVYMDDALAKEWNWFELGNNEHDIQNRNKSLIAATREYGAKLVATFADMATSVKQCEGWFMFPAGRRPRHQVKKRAF